jgi:hypothetical protein
VIGEEFQCFMSRLGVLPTVNTTTRSCGMYASDVCGLSIDFQLIMVFFCMLSYEPILLSYYILFFQFFVIGNEVLLALLHLGMVFLKVSYFSLSLSQSASWEVPSHLF